MKSEVSAPLPPDSIAAADSNLRDTLDKVVILVQLAIAARGTAENQRPAIHMLRMLNLKLQECLLIAPPASDFVP